MNLYLIAHSDDDGNNWDALIEAPTPARAKEIWAETYWGETTDLTGPPERIFQAQPKGREGMLRWHTDDLRLIEDNR